MSTASDDYFKCSYSVAAYMESIGFPQLVALGRQRRAKYIRQQLAIQKQFVLEGSKDHLPPCVNCPPGVFLYCQQTSTECKMFTIYLGCGKNKRHKCFDYIETHKRANPEMTKYCTEDVRTITSQADRKPYIRRPKCVK